MATSQIKSTLALNANPETRIKLIGIAKNTKQRSLSTIFSSGTNILSTEQEIRDTKQARIFIPLLKGVKKFSDVLAQAKTNSVATTEGLLAERQVSLANEMITEPTIWRPRDGEVIEASELLGRYQEGFSISASVFKDRAYFETMVVQGHAGLSTGQKLGASDTTSLVDANGNAIAGKEKELAQAIRKDIKSILTTKDKFVQGGITRQNLVIAVRPGVTFALEQDAYYNMYSQASKGVAEAQNDFLLPDFTFYGVNAYETNQLPDGVDYVVTVKGAASSIFLFKGAMNFDKVAGVNAYAMSLEFNEGTMVALPQLIRVGAKAATYAKQDAVGFGKLTMTIETAVTTAIDPA